jgi:hypothetical protein
MSPDFLCVMIHSLGFLKSKQFYLLNVTNLKVEHNPYAKYAKLAF